VLEAAPPRGFAMPGLLTAGRIDVVEDGGGVAQAIAARLAAAGVDARVVEEVSGDAAGAIFARGLRSARSLDEAVAMQRAALQAARAIAQRAGRHVFVTLQDTGGDFGLSGRAGDRAWTGGLAGLAKTAAAEWPDAGVKAIDVAASGVSSDLVARYVVAELLLGGSDVEVGLDREGRRAVMEMRPAAYGLVPRQTPRVRKGLVIVVSGGARGVTAAALAPLCKQGPRLALLGRTALVAEDSDTQAARTDADIRRVLLARAKAAGVAVQPKELAREAKLILDCREIRENVAALQRAGAEVTYHPVDVRSVASVRAVVDDVRRSWGPIGGIIHGAGVLADAALAAQTDEQFDLVFGTKVDGLHHLLAATAGDPLELLMLFSSVAGRFGNSGQAAYSMANEALSCVAAGERVRRGPRCSVRSLAWGPWAGGMVTPGLAKIFEKAGVQLVGLAAGAEALAREVESTDEWPQVVLMNGEPPASGQPLHGGKEPTGEERFDVLVNATTHPFLDGHRIKGAAVVPAVMALEWLARAATAFCPKLVVTGCRDLKVLRGIPVEGFDQRGLRLVVHLRTIATDAAKTELEAKLFDDQDRPRYSAVVEMARAPAVPPEGLPGVPADGKAWPWTLEHAYSEILFHRGPFATVRSLGLISESGASGGAVGMRSVGWPEAGWVTDVALMDGGVQVAALWGTHILGRLPLPTRIGAFHLYERGPVATPVRCFVRGQRMGQHRVLADLAYVREDGRVVCTIHDLDFHLPAAATRRPTEPGAA
jgi:NAD(P)-dependent dehydrogenase (short-subunit alcohol dehydrogenase family)